MVGEMSVRGYVLVGKCPVRELSFGELSVRGNVRRGSVCRKFVLGEVSVGEVSGRETVLQSLCPCLLIKEVTFHRCSIKRQFMEPLLLSYGS